MGFGHNPVKARKIGLPAVVGAPTAIGFLQIAPAKGYAHGVKAQGFDLVHVLAGDPVVLPNVHQLVGLGFAKAFFEFLQGKAHPDFVVEAAETVHPVFGHEPAAQVGAAQLHGVAVAVFELVDLLARAVHRPKVTRVRCGADCSGAEHAVAVVQVECDVASQFGGAADAAGVGRHAGGAAGFDPVGAGSGQGDGFVVQNRAVEQFGVVGLAHDANGRLGSAIELEGDLGLGWGG